jgi:hypothetical protein
MAQRIRFIAVVCLVVLGASAARAWAQPEGQSSSDPIQDEGRFRFGPLRFTPSLALTNIGVDSNVFNDAKDPKQDTTAAVGPAVNLYMNIGRSKFTGKVTGQYLYFGTYDNQRAWNTSDEGRWELALARLRPFVVGSYANTKERPGFEIDSRARQRTDSLGVGTAVDLSAKTTLLLTATRSHLAFEEGQLFLGVDLADALNRTSDSEEVQFLFKLTPLTTFVVNGSAVQDRFTFDRLRDSRSVKVLPGFEFKPSALISGKVFVGYRRFTATNPELPDFEGAIASVDARYVLGSMRLGVKVARDLTYSYEPTDPYYALTDLSLTITERIARAWELVGTGGWQELDYQQIRSSTPLPGRVETVREFGGGVGYRIGRVTRLGFDAIYYQRRSSLDIRGFEGLRYGASFRYGLPQ